MASRKNEIQVEWLDSKDKGKVNSVHVKHVVEDRREILPGAVLTVKLSGRKYKAIVKDLLLWQKPQAARKRTGTKLKKPLPKKPRTKPAFLDSASPAEEVQVSSSSSCSSIEEVTESPCKDLQRSLSSLLTDKAYEEAEEETHSCKDHPTRAPLSDITNLEDVDLDPSSEDLSCSPLPYHPHTPHSPPSHTPHSPPSHTPHSSPSHTPYPPPSHTPYPSPSHTPYPPPSHTPYPPPSHTTYPPPSYTPYLLPSHTPYPPPSHTPYPPPSHYPHTSYPPPSHYPHTSYPPPLHYPHTPYPPPSHHPHNIMYSLPQSSPLHSPHVCSQCASCSHSPYTPPANHPHQPTNTTHLETPSSHAACNKEEVFENFGRDSPLRIKQDVVQECYKAANSEKNLAVQLAKRCFSKRERSLSNCAGYKKKVLSPARLFSLKKAIFSVYPVKPGQSQEIAWREYRKAIDASCRKTHIF